MLTVENSLFYNAYNAAAQWMNQDENCVLGCVAPHDVVFNGPVENKSSSSHKPFGLEGL